jgi:hypothetical protein
VLAIVAEKVASYGIEVKTVAEQIMVLTLQRGNSSGNIPARRKECKTSLALLKL